MPARATMAAAPSWTEKSSLRTYFQTEYRPALEERLHSKWVARYDVAVDRFEEFVGRTPCLGSATPESIAQFEKILTGRGCSAKNAKNLAGCIRTIVNGWRGEKPARIKTLPPPEPGTLRYWFEEHYRIEEMFHCRISSIDDTRRAIVAFYSFCGDKDVCISELSSGLVAAFCQRLWRNKMLPVTINNKYRAPILAVANHALQHLELDRVVRVKKLREVRNPPRAWNVSEMKKLVDAAREFRPNKCYEEIPCSRFWVALLLVAYETGLRRSALFSLKRSDIDLETGWLIVDGNSQKALKGQCFKLSDASLRALQLIWEPARDCVFAVCKMRTIDNHFSELIETAGVRYTRRGLNKFHAIRRTSATLICAEKGIAAASSFLSHSDSQVTLRYIDPTQLRHDVTNVLPSLSAG